MASLPTTVPDDRSSPALTFTLAVVSGPAAGRVEPLTGTELVVGSGPEADLKLADPAASRLHLAISVRSAGIHLRDLGSTNGTWIGAYRVAETLVPGGTVVRVGQTLLHLRGNDGAASIGPSEADRFGDLRGGSIAMRQLYAVLERVAAAACTVMLDGETGTGKEVCARALHRSSRRSGGPFVVLDGSAVAPDLAESHLFGHVRGSFTGAVGDRRGVFEEASGGTLFLDEFDSLPATLQPKLLRALESRAVVRVGENVERPVDVRVIAACGRDPEGLMAAGLLRPDLYFRLAVVRLTMPALRDRLDDLPDLCAHLLGSLGSEIRVGPGRSLDRLRAHGWPGNVRELRNVIERALALAPVGTPWNDLPLQLGLPGVVPRVSSVDLHEALAYKVAKERVLGAWEKPYLQAALERCGHNLSRTAREVGLTRVHLRVLLRKHGLVEP